MGNDVVVLARFLLTGIALLLAFLATAAWGRRKDAPEAGTFAILVAALAIYAFGYAGEIAQTTLSGATLWLHVEYLALPWIPGLWLLAAYRHKGTQVRVFLLFIIPVITFIGHFTNFQNLFYSGPIELLHRGPFWVLTVRRGPLSMLDNAYLLIAFLTGAWIYMAGLRHASALFRKQAFVLMMSSVLPFFGYFIFFFNLSPWGLDITPITLGLTCVLIYYGIFYCGIFDLAPLARNLIFNGIRDAVVILDTQSRLLDFNPAAQTFLPMLNKRRLGTDISVTLADFPTMLEALARPEDSVEFAFGPEDNPRLYEIRNWPLISAFRQVGRAVIFADVTAQVRLREELRLRAETDPLTGIANRRRFQQALEIECLRFSRGQAPFSLLMLDLDHFKDINDRYGHPVGDLVLKNVAQLLLVTLRKTDVLARYGGEEFAVLLPETRSEGAQIIAERIRITVCDNPIEVDEELIHTSISVGITSHANGDADPQLLLKRADLALYRAKGVGRNRVEII
jgi:diguanylate cyclase (GGDEF)-like protein